MHCLKIKNKRGFTLIEVIVSLIVAGIMGAMLVAFMSSGVIHSADPVILAKNGAYLNEIMENMATDYKYLQAANNNPGPVALELFRQKVVSTSPRYYGSGYTATATYVSIPSGSANVTATNDSYHSSAANNLQITVTYQGLTATALFGG